MLSGRGVIKISGIVLTNCTSFVLGIGGVRDCHVVCRLCSADVATRRHDALLGQRPTDMCAPTDYWEKRNVRSVEMCQGDSGRVSLWCLEASLFRHLRIAIPVRGPLGYCYFLFLFILFRIYFIFFFLVCYWFLISYLIPTTVMNRKRDFYPMYGAQIQHTHPSRII